MISYSFVLTLLTNLIVLAYPRVDEPEDLFLLAQAYYETGQYRRAIHALQDLHSRCKKCKYLSAKCKVRPGGPARYFPFGAK